jgi:hypothetical protein
MINLVAYDLKTPNDTPENYERIIGAIKSKFDSWCRIEQSVWLVDTGLDPAPVRELLKPYMHTGDVLYVARLYRNWASWNFGDERNKWLNNRQF